MINNESSRSALPVHSFRCGGHRLLIGGTYAMEVANESGFASWSPKTSFLVLELVSGAFTKKNRLFSLTWLLQRFQRVGKLLRNNKLLLSEKRYPYLPLSKSYWFDGSITPVIFVQRKLPKIVWRKIKVNKQITKAVRRHRSSRCEVSLPSNYHVKISLRLKYFVTQKMCLMVIFIGNFITFLWLWSQIWNKIFRSAKN